MTEKEALKLIEKWQYYWMDQPDYKSRACYVDANMRYHLAKLIHSETLPKPKKRRSRTVR